jgi:hypothetical protein
MGELELQKFLRAGHSLDELRKPPYSLYIKEEGNLVLFKYTQGVSDGFNPIVREARGIILSRVNNWDAICHPFHRFFNFNQPEADGLHGALHVYEKVDGSLVKAFYYDGEWRCASNGCIDARDVSINGKSFFSLVEKALNTYRLTWETFTDGLNPMCTYMYELATQDNPVVIQYTGYHLYYLGERNNFSGEEHYVPDPRIDNVKVYNFETFHDIVNSSLHMKDDEEGYVVRDNEWHRVKVKNPTYFLAHHLANNGRPDFLDILLNGDVKEFLNYFPQYEKDIEEAKEIFAQMNEEAEMLRDCTSEFWDCARKDFVASIDVPKPFQSFIFKCYEDHALTWKKFTADWDYNKWKRFLKKNEYYFNPSEA